MPDRTLTSDDLGLESLDSVDWVDSPFPSEGLFFLKHLSGLCPFLPQWVQSLLAYGFLLGLDFFAAVPPF
jgi:hypothetical protein